MINISHIENIKWIIIFYCASKAELNVNAESTKIIVENNEALSTSTNCLRIHRMRPAISLKNFASSKLSSKICLVFCRLSDMDSDNRSRSDSLDKVMNS